jgi:hypothetical protein
LLFLIAPTGQASSQDTAILTIALYGHARIHILQLLHLLPSIANFPLTILIASNLQTFKHGFDTHP